MVEGQESVWYAVTLPPTFLWNPNRRLISLSAFSKLCKEKGIWDWMHGAGNKSQVCKMERPHCFVFAKDYHCSSHLHSLPIIVIVVPILILTILVVIVIVVIVTTAVISLDSSLVALVAPAVCASVWSNQVSAPKPSTLLFYPPQFLTIEMWNVITKNFPFVANLYQPNTNTNTLLQCSEYTAEYWQRPRGG